MSELINTNDNRMTVCYCGNSKVFPMIAMSALSVATRSSRPLTAVILTMDYSELDPKFVPVTETQSEILDRALKTFNPENDAKILRADAEYRAVLKGGKNEKSFYTPYTLLRLLLSHYNLGDRILYLDADVMCCADLAELFDVDLTDYEFAAVRDHMGQHFYGRNYFNAGVMYFNLKKSKETGLLDRACTLVKTKKMMLKDQDALNKSATKKLILPRRFNEQRAIKPDTVLKHFCQGIKWLPFFHVYNIKQTERDKVHKKLKINDFDDIYDLYDELIAPQLI
ncbi:MAG: hypothetical protein HDT28_08940 [Clostridiales bacterium]|nr:hypothetical protein [Clostridiales bacterium]